MKKKSQLVFVLLAIVLGMVSGALTGKETLFFGKVTYFSLFSFAGQLFLNALTLLVLPMIASAIIYGISQMGKEPAFGRLGGKTFFFYILTTLLAVLTGLCFVNLISPGTHHDASLTESLGQSDLLSKHPHEPGEALSALVTKFVPVNIVEAAASGNMLGVIAFSLLFGLALAKLEHSIGETLILFWKGVFFTLMKMTHFLMKILPLGVFCLVAKVIAEQGFETIEALLFFVLAVILGLVTFAFVILPILLRLMGISPWKHLRAMGPALVTAFSTSSSAATLPITIECVEKRAGVSNRICSFVVPLGTSLNMAGSALYECVAVLFIAQVYGIEMSFIHQLIVVVLSLLTSMGVAAIPSASLVAIMIILNSMGLPLEGIILVLPADRILDMCRTTVNVFSDASCAVLVAHSEGEPVAVLKNSG